MVNNSRNLIEVKQLYKSFLVKGGKVPVLRGIDLSVAEKDFTIIYGPSGCGKSTLLHTILGLERPTGGKVFIFGKDLYRLTSDERADIRRTKVGMLYQQSNWIKTFNVQDNVALPLNLLGQTEQEAGKGALGVLEQVGLEDWRGYVPTELSAGQQQRVGLARALISDPEILIVDEPTGNLDSKAGLELMELLKVLSRKRGKTVIMVTHDLRLLTFATRVIEMNDGVIVKEYRGGRLPTIERVKKE
ncbi:MAG: ABC transporter ATP-binding protein [Patescibacteria group bacterium]|nr:MAG: ABC transporter ATP-binding protein [Patescibacteria group bacterium]